MCFVKLLFVHRFGYRNDDSLMALSFWFQIRMDVKGWIETNGSLFYLSHKMSEWAKKNYLSSCTFHDWITFSSVNNWMFCLHERYFAIWYIQLFNMEHRKELNTQLIGSARI